MVSIFHSNVYWAAEFQWVAVIFGFHNTNLKQQIKAFDRQQDLLAFKNGAPDLIKITCCFG